ncbi:hypothetical protein E2C01_079397 [Portunus trituberculatus]|uniref:Uncharacterized protein n=1 Tax=Portunus trituberculatus TaxID=210409 RepID=A0A5B7ILE9_PORTR|nr:hypothetical protein [Portunus trituberculatus]
MALCGGGVTG